MEPYAVTYWAQTARAWVTHGSLTARMALDATLMYGFAAPDGRSWVMAGSVPGVVTDVAASGAWTGYLFGLVQVGRSGCLAGSISAVVLGAGGAKSARQAYLLKPPADRKPHNTH